MSQPDNLSTIEVILQELKTQRKDIPPIPKFPDKSK